MNIPFTLLTRLSGTHVSDLDITSSFTFKNKKEDIISLDSSTAKTVDLSIIDNLKVVILQSDSDFTVTFSKDSVNFTLTVADGIPCILPISNTDIEGASILVSTLSTTEILVKIQAYGVEIA